MPSALPGKKKNKILKILKACKGLVYFPDRQDVNLQCAFDAAVTTNRKVADRAKTYSSCLLSSLKEGTAREKKIRIKTAVVRMAVHSRSFFELLRIIWWPNGQKPVHVLSTCLDWSCLLARKLLLAACRDKGTLRCWNKQRKQQQLQPYNALVRSSQRNRRKGKLQR